MKEPFLINLDVDGRKYPLTIEREDEELVRAAAKQIQLKLNQYRQHYFINDIVTKSLDMVAIQLSISELRLTKMKDTTPFVDKIQQLNEELERYLTSE
jgi:cell division protein ZapA